MTSRFMIFDPLGNYLTDIDMPSTPRAWVLNDVGECSFQMPLGYAKTLERYLRYGNLVHIQHVPSVPTNGKLPTWTGIILRDRIWRNDDVIECKAHSAEAIATVRPLPWVDGIKSTPKVVFESILRLGNTIAQRYNGIQIQVGTVEDRPVQIADDFRQQMYEHIVNLIKRTRMSWSITGEVDTKGKLNLYGNLYADIGRFTGLTLTNLNSESASPLLREEGTPFNVIFGYSQAQTARQRFPGIGINADSLALHGFMGRNSSYMGLHDEASTKSAAQAEADIYGQPFLVMDRNALDLGDTFSRLRVGDAVHIDEHGAGFNLDGGFGIQSDAIILSMTYNDNSNKVAMHLEVI